MTHQPTFDAAGDGLAALPAAIAQACDTLLSPNDDLRFIVNGAGNPCAASNAGSGLLGAFASLNEDVVDELCEWLRHDVSGEFGLRLTTSCDDPAQSYMAQKVALDHFGVPGFWLVLLRKPKLSGSLIHALSQSRALYKDIVHTVPGLVWETARGGAFNFVSGRPLGGLRHGDLVGETPATALAIPEQTAMDVFCCDVPVNSIDVWVSSPKGDKLCLSVSAKPVIDNKGVWQGARGIALDVTAERLDGEALDEASAMLQKNAITDSLTGLYNRRGFEERLNKVCRQLRSADKGGFLALIDLDKFKQLNDTQGHHVGDAALIAVGQMLETHSRSNDVAARLGGDEFALWMDACSQDGAQRVCEAMQSAMPRLCDDLALPGFGLSLSIGVTAFRPGRDDLEAMLKRADALMYAVKRAGRGHHNFDEDCA